MSVDKGNKEQLTYHQGLTELLAMKRSMLVTVCRCCLLTLIVALVVAFILLFVNSRYWLLLQHYLKDL